MGERRVSRGLLLLLVAAIAIAILLPLSAGAADVCVWAGAGQSTSAAHVDIYGICAGTNTYGDCDGGSGGASEFTVTYYHNHMICPS